MRTKQAFEFIRPVASNLKAADHFIGGNIPDSDRPRLASSLRRYTNLSGWESNGDPAQVSADRRNFPQFIKDNDKYVSFDEKDCAEFMALTTGLPASWCIVWVMRYVLVGGMLLEDEDF